MIDWYLVATSSLWILGLSIVLAAFSYHHWLAGEKGRRLREQFREPSWKIPFSSGMMLTCLGFGLGENTRWWERAVWFALLVSFAIEVAVSCYAMRGSRRGTPDDKSAAARPGSPPGASSFRDGE